MNETVMSPIGDDELESRYELAELMLDLFQGRNDRILIGDANGRVRSEVIDSPLEVRDLVEDHLAVTDNCLGFYPMTDDNCVRCAAIDFDSKPGKRDPEWKKKTERVYRLFNEHGVSSLVEVSQSGEGSHVWVFFAEALPSTDVRLFLRETLQAADVKESEIYPRQDSLPKGKVGNPIRFPLFRESCFVDVDRDWRRVDPLVALKSVHKLTMSSFEIAAPSMRLELSAQIALRGNASRFPGRRGFAKRRSSKPNPPEKQLIPYVAELLSDRESTFARRWRGDGSGLADESRSSVAFSLVCTLIRRYVATADIEATLRCWCKARNYQKGERDDWIATTISGAYKFVQRKDAEWREEKKDGFMSPSATFGSRGVSKTVRFSRTQ